MVNQLVNKLTVSEVTPYSQASILGQIREPSVYNYVRWMGYKRAFNGDIYLPFSKCEVASVLSLQQPT
jgi:hypothetical protein